MAGKSATPLVLTVCTSIVKTKEEINTKAMRGITENNTSFCLSDIPSAMKKGRFFQTVLVSQIRSIECLSALNIPIELVMSMMVPRTILGSAPSANDCPTAFLIKEILSPPILFPNWLNTVENIS